MSLRGGLKIFIVFEGGEGAGKSTQIQMLFEYLSSLGHNVIVTREPGGNPISEAIRGILKDKKNAAMTAETESLLYFAARAQLIADFIKPHLSKGYIILCDRFAMSTFAYQGYAGQLDVDNLKYINNFATEGLTPDATIFLDINPKEGLKRKVEQEALDRIEEKGIEYHEKVWLGYKKLAEEDDKIVTVDAMMAVDKIHEEIKKYIDGLLPTRHPELDSGSMWDSAYPN
ncbi:MAG: dTMP kinase [Defluviitaleaceae bacterium]|nr:dTMP kinase [Defluviitaleaceae bacterium]